MLLLLVFLSFSLRKTNKHHILDTARSDSQIHLQFVRNDQKRPPFTICMLPVLTDYFCEGTWRVFWLLVIFPPSNAEVPKLRTADQYRASKHDPLSPEETFDLLKKKLNNISRTHCCPHTTVQNVMILSSFLT